MGKKMFMKKFGIIGGWDLASAVYDTVSFSFTTQATNMRAGCFSEDGLKFYGASRDTDFIYQYNLTTAWDISTMSYSGVSFNIATYEASCFDITFKTDGTKMYIAGSAGQEINQFTLSTAWDLSTAVFSGLKSVSAQGTSPYGLDFKPDGTKVYIANNSDDTVYQYSLTTAWDITTLVYDSISKVVYITSLVNSFTTGIFMKPDGTKMYITDTGYTGGSVTQFSLSVAWDLSTAVYDSIFYSVNIVDKNIYAIMFKPDGKKMYLTGVNTNTLYQYTLL